MKKILVLAFILVVAVGATCMAAQKVLKVGCQPTFAPFEFVDEKGEIVGFDIDLIKVIGKRAGYKVEVQNIGFDALIPSVQTKIIDCAISGMTITEARSKVITFSAPYYTAGLRVMTLKDNDAIKSYADLKGKRIACQIGTTGENKSRQVPGGIVTAYNTHAEAAMELVTGGADALISDAPVVAYFLKTPAGKNCKSVGEVLEAEDYGIAFNKDDRELIKAINKALVTVKKDGSYDKLYAKWFN